MLPVNLDIKDLDFFQKVLQEVALGLMPEALDPLTKKVAAKAYALLVAATPKQKGDLRAAWVIVYPEKAKAIIENNKVIRTEARGEVQLLELLRTGTGVFGPSKSRIYPTRSRALYVPLTTRAKSGYRKNLKYGTDYVFAQYIRGFRTNKKRRPVEAVEKRVEDMFEKEIVRHINKLISKVR